MKKRNIQFVLFLFLISCQISLLSAQKVFPLYAAGVPNSLPGLEQDKMNKDSSVYFKVYTPSLTLYLPEKDKATGTAVIICPGGGYAVINIKREGHDVAKQFASMGIAAFVLKYRLPDAASMQNKSIGPLQDLQQAIKTVRVGALNWNIDTNRIGVMGFSAGGHLAASAGTHFNNSLIENASSTSLRPNFMILVYPVISFNESFGHLGSRDNLLGKTPSKKMVSYFSNELHVNKNTPPTFLIHATDDKVVSVLNPLKFYEALNRHKVPAALHIYEKGGHGFGSTPSFDEWMGRCVHWMKSRNL